MDLEFRSYRIEDGYMRDPSLLMFGPRIVCTAHSEHDAPQRRRPHCKDCRPVPGTQLVKVPQVSRLQLRLGIVVGIDAGRVHVMWNPWTTTEGCSEGELRRLMGVLDARERKRQRWQERKRERTELNEMTPKKEEATP